ncbi:MAG: hypothetical protein GY874_21500 [Desulfobacteraceae bacterium]|nr:hypothetical protein [Desulfobacteraceae bacterium]
MPYKWVPKISSSQSSSNQSPITPAASDKPLGKLGAKPGLKWRKKTTPPVSHNKIPSSKTVQANKDQINQDQLKKLKTAQIKKAHDDSSPKMLSLRRKEVFESFLNPKIKFKLGKFKNKADMEKNIDVIKKAIEVVPAKRAVKKVVDHLKATGEKGLDHIEPMSLVQKDSDEKKLMLDLLNVTGSSKNITGFDDWCSQLVNQQMGRKAKKKPEKMKLGTAKNVTNQFKEARAAVSIVEHSPEAKVAINGDMIKQKTKRKGNRSFDIQANYKGVNRQIEVKNLQKPVKRPRDLKSIFRHGVDKARDFSPRKGETVSLEASGVIEWEKCTEKVPGGKIKYHGDGYYTVLMEGKKPYRRHIIKDDLSHYLHRHPSDARGLKRVSILTRDNSTDAPKHCYHLNRGPANSWSVEAHAEPDSLLQKERNERDKLRHWLSAPKTENTYS